MRIALPLAFALCLACLAPSARAEEAPDYTAESLIFVQTDLPTGWRVLDSEDCPADLPTEDQVTAAGGEGVDTFEITTEYRLLAGPGGEHAVIAIIDVDLEGGPLPYRKGLDALAAPHGWKVVPLAHPQRLMLVAAPAGNLDMLVKWQQLGAARKLVALAYDRLMSDFEQGKSGRLSMTRADEYADAALKIQADMPAAKVIHGMVQVMREDKEGGIHTLRAGLAASGDLGATPRMRFFGWGLVGRALINDTKKKPATPEQNKDAVKAFRKAIEQEDAALEEANERNDATLRLRIWGTRYNLSCGLVRIGDKEAAFKELERCLTIGQRLLSLGNKWGMWFEHAWFWDEDLQPIRADKRFMELMKKFAPENYDWEKRKTELAKMKKKRDAERAKSAAAEKAKKDKEEGEGDGKDGGKKDGGAHG